ncbi:cupin domain-containing protein [Thermomicrobium sp. 4228-Ro]|uniref:cupin domain-containing protein n=1 Tax=Thermomicrobium sp. 4228-Ro TaxID=2993937 RepID=UPI002248D251|nr:cupin domain-containing protein [Thermomicrobium sp. 4228-Ro]MCX2728350.1 cupin domain-containing protein [Thermomicrobium sp. 4228-Ro]
MAAAERVTLYRWSTMPEEVPRPGVIRQTVNAERQTLVRYRYAPGSVFPVHAHPEEQITVVLRGTLAFEIDGTELLGEPGDVIVIPGGVAHGARVVGDEEVETLNTFVPRREQAP